MKNKKNIKTISLNEVSNFREEIIDGLINNNWHEDINVLLVSICKLHEIGYRKIPGQFENAVKWQINSEKIRSL